MIRIAISLACCLLPAIAAPRDYRFNGKISRVVLENYLSRSITMTEIYRSPGNLDDDNFGGTRTPGQASQAQRANIFVWGYDEITWFAQQPEEYRNQWLRYAWNWIKEHDPAGHLQMPGGRMLTHGPTNWYFANTKGQACPQGFSQEETIKSIWLDDSGK